MIIPGTLLVTLCGLASAALAEDPQPVCDPEQPSHCSAAMTAGQVAPFDGQLVSPDLAITLGQRAEHCDARIGLEADRVRGLERAEAQLCRRMAVIDKAAAGERERLLQEALEACEGTPWWESPPFVAAVTAVVTTAALLGVWYVAIETVKATAER